MKHKICFIILLCAGFCWAQITVPPRPDSASRIVAMRFELDTSKFPPTPKGYSQVTDPKSTLTVTPSPNMLNEQQIRDLRQRAEADARLKQALGIRYAFLSASRADIGDKSAVTQKQDVRLVYFNYTTNRAVHVQLSTDTVKTVQVQPRGYQPPESGEEIKIAEEIVRRDSRYTEAVKGLPVRGILTPAPEGRRYIYLMFKKPQEPAAFAATVDLTEGKIVTAAPIKHQ